MQSIVARPGDDAGRICTKACPEVCIKINSLKDLERFICSPSLCSLNSWKLSHFLALFIVLCLSVCLPVHECVCWCICETSVHVRPLVTHCVNWCTYVPIHHPLFLLLYWLLHHAIASTTWATSLLELNSIIGMKESNIYVSVCNIVPM